MGSSLLGIAREIRDIIYRPVLRIPTASRADVTKWPTEFSAILTRTPQNPQLASVLSIIYTCRQINAEASGIFEEVNDLLIKIPNRMNTFLSQAQGSLGDRRLYLNTVTLFVKGPHLTLTAVKFLSLLPHLHIAKLAMQNDRSAEEFAEVPGK